MFSLLIVFLIWILGFGFLSFYFKENISNFIILKSKFPIFVNYFLLILPLILIEEFLTCEILFFSCIQITIPAFYLFFIILFFIQKYFNLDYLKASILFGIIGWFNEFILVGRIFQLDLFTIILFTILVILIYIILAIIPSFYLEKSFKLKSNNK